MKYFKLKKIGIVELLFWVIMSTIISLVFRTINFLQFFQIAIFLIASFFTGELFFSYSDVLQRIPFLIRSSVNIIIGGIILSTFAYLFDPTILIYVVFAAFLYSCIALKRVVFCIEYRDFVALSPLLLLFINPNEFLIASKAGIKIISGDYFYYTAVTESLKQNFNFNNAFYHINLPINYAHLPFQASALMARFASIKSDLALYGIYSRILPFASFSVVSYFIVSYCYKIANYTSLNMNKEYIHKFFANFILLLLGPINPLALFKLDLNNILFLGMGYLLPLGSQGFALAILFCGLILITLFLSNNEKYRMIYLIIFLFAMLFSKFALFLPVLAFIGLQSLYKVRDKEYKLFFALIIAMPLLYWGYSLITGGSKSISKTSFTFNGYFINFFIDTAVKYHLAHFPTWVKLALMALLSILSWLSYKTLIVYFAYKKINGAYSKEVKRIIYCLLFVLIITLCLGSFVDVYGVDSEKNKIFDLKFDTKQFLRAGIFLFTIFSFVFFTYFIFFYHNKKYKFLLLLLTLVVAALNSTGFFSSTYIKADIGNNLWYTEVITDFNLVKPKLMIVKGEEFFSGTYLSSFGIGPWYCTGTRNSKEGYTMNIGSHTRSIYFQQLLDSSVSVSQKKQIITELKNQKVDCIVATPNDTAIYSKLIQQALIIKKKGTKWMYDFKK